MNKDNLQIDTFSFDHFKVEVVTQEETYEAWLYHPSIGVKELMFGLLKENYTYDQFLTAVERALLFDSYIEFYEQEYMYHESEN